MLHSGSFRFMGGTVGVGLPHLPITTSFSSLSQLSKLHMIFCIKQTVVLPMKGILIRLIIVTYFVLGQGVSQRPRATRFNKILLDLPENQSEDSLSVERCARSSEAIRTANAVILLPWSQLCCGIKLREAACPCYVLHLKPLFSSFPFFLPSFLCSSVPSRRTPLRKSNQTA